MTLKGICNCLVRKSATLDSVALFCSPQTLLQPLCQLLDRWEGHEDQGIIDKLAYFMALTTGSGKSTRLRRIRERPSVSINDQTPLRAPVIRSQWTGPRLVHFALLQISL